MRPAEIENYFDAIGYFDNCFDPTSKDKIELTKIFDELYASWPNTAITLAEQGFFISMLQLN